MKAIILHGTQGAPDGNWFRWLKRDLEQRGWRVWLPTLPHTERPSLREMADFVHANAPFELDGQTVLVGHSTGATLALILAQENAVPLRATFCVSTVRDNKALRWEANDRLEDVAFDFDAIRAHSGKLVFVHSDDDPYVPLTHAQSLAANAGGELIVIPGQGHFNLEQGEQYREFPALLPIVERAAA